jgi:tetratricopeptide (TPR) repeat protein
MERSSLPIDEKRRVLFALGKLHDALSDYKAAFEYYKQANEQLKSHIDFWSADYFANAPVARKRNKGQQLIFIVGMPRSGTSLVEQIIASHPAVYAAGELQEITDLSVQLPVLTKSDKPYPLCLETASRSVLDTAAKKYLKAVSKRAGSNKFTVTTDKMPSNYWHLGLIQLLFPGAKIIHCIRDPRDTCLSCYFQNFAGQHPYANDLLNLGMYYRQYEKLMRHWRNVLDLEIMDVRYENLVADPEQVSRQLIEYCKLDWNPGVLRYYESKRTVVTSSFDQVTKPIYKKSLARWHHYEAFLEPLHKGLGYDI